MSESIKPRYRHAVVPIRRGKLLYHLQLPGRPVSKGNSGRIIKRKGGGSMMLPSEAAVEATKAIEAMVPVQKKLLDRPIFLDAVFWFRVPKSRKDVRPGMPYDRKVDRGNLLKLVEDALEGRLYFDDKMIVGGDVMKAYGAQDVTEVWISEVEMEWRGWPER